MLWLSPSSPSACTSAITQSINTSDSLCESFSWSLLHLIFRLSNHSCRVGFTHLLAPSQVPVYAIDAWFSLRFLEIGAYLELIRHCYEAYTLYLFFMLLVNYLEGEDNIIAIFGIWGVKQEESS